MHRVVGIPAKDEERREDGEGFASGAVAGADGFGSSYMYNLPSYPLIYVTTVKVSMSATCASSFLEGSRQTGCSRARYEARFYGRGTAVGGKRRRWVGSGFKVSRLSMFVLMIGLVVWMAMGVDEYLREWD